MENWRKYIKENKAVWLEKKLITLGLYIEQTNYGYNIALMDFKPDAPYPQVIGMIETVRSEKPCIPKTHEIGVVATHPSIANTGIGTFLYEIAALIVHENFQGGITSDHQSSTTNPAADVWKRLEYKFDYVKRKTPEGPEKETYEPDTGEALPAFKGGNDKFDYDGWVEGVPPEKQLPGATRDPFDDCDDIIYGKEATDHSLGIPPERIPWVRKIMTVQIQNYHDYKGRFSVRYGIDLDARMSTDANRLFNDQYKPNEVGIYQGDK